jgi:hypothetical protein
MFALDKGRSELVVSSKLKQISGSVFSAELRKIWRTWCTVLTWD